jgi:glycosyltransferase involved in cell wall biosynthesis
MWPPLLTICIPTYNRAFKLDKQLNRIFEIISSSPIFKDVGVYISDNGSSDHTQEVITAHAARFKANLIYFTAYKQEKNIGFDANLYSCYDLISSDYIWFLSDDDIPHPHCLHQILSDISITPNLIAYNFHQEPYILTNPYYDDRFIKVISSSNVHILAKIAKWPKLSSLIVKKYPLDPLLIDLCLPFAHTVISTYISLLYGNILVSQFFIASVDVDYMDSIDFPPYVGNSIIPMLGKLYSYLNRLSLLNIILPLFEGIHVNPFYESLSVLKSNNEALQYVSPQLKSQFRSLVVNELRLNPFLVFSRAFCFYIISFLFRVYPFRYIAVHRKARRYQKNSTLLSTFLSQ